MGSLSGGRFTTCTGIPKMNKVRFLIAAVALTLLAACGDLGPTAPQENGPSLGGILGSGG
jgi:hypothetical protein